MMMVDADENGRSFGNQATNPGDGPVPGSQIAFGSVASSVLQGSVRLINRLLSV